MSRPSPCILLPIVTFAMAYMIVDVPKPGDIRTNQVSTILASDGSELAKIVPPEGNRVDVDIDQIPVHVRDAVMAAEDRDFYTNPGFSFTRLRRGRSRTTSSAATCRAVRRSPSSTSRTRWSVTRDPAWAASSARPRNSSSRRRCRGEWSKDQCCSPTSTSSTSAAVRTASARRRRRTSASPSSSSTVAEGALLAALIQQPSALDPAVDPEGSPSGGTGCSTAWSTIGALSPTDRAAQVFPPTVPPDQAQHAEPDHRAQRADRTAGHQGTARPVRHRRTDA